MSSDITTVPCRTLREIVPPRYGQVDYAKLQVIDLVYPNDSRYSRYTPCHCIESKTARSIVSRALVSYTAPLTALRLPRLSVDSWEQAIAYREVINLLALRANRLTHLTFTPGFKYSQYRPVLRLLSQHLPALRVLVLRDANPEFLRNVSKARPNIQELKIQYCSTTVKVDTSNALVRLLRSYASHNDSLKVLHFDLILEKEENTASDPRVLADFVCQEVATVLRKENSAKNLRDVSLVLNAQKTEMENFDSSFVDNFKILQRRVALARINESWYGTRNHSATATIRGDLNTSDSTQQNESPKIRYLNVELNMSTPYAFICANSLAHGANPSTCFSVSFPEVSMRFLPSFWNPIITKISLVENVRLFLRGCGCILHLDSVRIPSKCTCTADEDGISSERVRSCSVKHALESVDDFVIRDDVRTLQIDMAVVGGCSADDCLDHLEIALQRFRSVHDLKVHYGTLLNSSQTSRWIILLSDFLRHVKRIHLMVPGLNSKIRFVPQVDCFLKNAEPFLRLMAENLGSLETVYFPEISESSSRKFWKEMEGKRVEELNETEQLSFTEGIQGSLNIASRSVKDLSKLAEDHVGVDIGCIFRHAIRRVKHLKRLSEEVEKQR